MRTLTKRMRIAVFLLFGSVLALSGACASSPKGRASGDSQHLLDTTDCESCTMILLWIWKQKTEYPLKTTTFRTHLAKNICFDKILTNENERNESRENTTKFKETAYAQNCPTDEKLAVHRPGGEHHCRGPAPTPGTPSTARTAATIIGGAPASTAPVLRLRPLRRSASRCGSSSRA